MKKIIVALGVLSMAGFAMPALAQDATAMKSLPKCSAKVQDSCDQSTTTERYALTADQAEKTGGVGDRHDGKGMAAPMGGKMMMHHHRHHHMMHKTTTTTTTTPPAAM